MTYFCLKNTLYRAGKIRFSGTKKSVLLKASSGDRCAPHNFVLCDVRRYMCLSHHVPCHVPNEIYYGNINDDTNSDTVASTEQPH